MAAQLQAEELGVPLSEALNDIAADVRRAAHQAARRRAQRATPRVSLIITSADRPGHDDRDRNRDPDLVGHPGERTAVNEEVKPRGPEGAGGWLESVCKLIVTLRVGILLVTLLALRDQGDRPLLIAAILVAAAWRRSCRCATGTASARRWCATRRGWRPRSSSRR